MPSTSDLPFAGQRVLIVGLAREGSVAARWLAERGAQIVISDLRTEKALDDPLASLAPLGVELRLGPQTPDLISDIDAVVASPGVPQDIPLLMAARVNSIPITSETRLFAQHCSAPLIGITGSSGKTTTTTLTARMLNHAGFTTWLGGNIGDPLLGRLSDIHPDDKVVMELSSFQLLYWREQPDTPDSILPWHKGRGLSPHIASVLNVTPNHLDRHPSMAHYTAAKAQVLTDQRADDLAILSHDDPITAGWASSGRVRIEPGTKQKAVDFPLKGRLLTFGLSQRPRDDGGWIEHDQIWLRHQDQTRPILPISAVRLRGNHNLSNVLAACCLAAASGAPADALAEIARDFTGVEHRLEEVSYRSGVLWVNDSIATSPERSLAALHSFDQPLILLAGGRDKHLPWEDWADAVHQNVRNVILFGDATTLIEEALTPIPNDCQLQSIHEGHDLEGAVELAQSLAHPGDVVLLSPGGTSYDAYADFAARGQHFRDLVAAL
jgi:UDP-N-acetylmuramoylalanine--D-glutamate ligase